jgi:hypothetical protein
MLHQQRSERLRTWGRWQTLMKIADESDFGIHVDIAQVT